MDLAQTMNALSAAAPLMAKPRFGDTTTMPDKGEKCWRKKIHSKPKHLPPLKVSGDDTTPVEDINDRRRHHGWRRTMHGARPATPVSATPPTPAIEDVEDARSERSETSHATPRRNSKPKLARYTALFTSFKEASKGPGFAEPWNEDAPPPSQPYIDPLDALQSIRSHMSSKSSKPIPLEHNSGPFRIFEDYGKVREGKEHLEVLLQDTFRDWKKAEEQWGESERHYEMEIRRLELLIARGTSGMAGLMNARQGSVVDRKRRYRKTSSSNRLPSMYGSLSPKQLDYEIKLRSQRVLLHRPVSPSGKMAALSNQFAGAITDLPTGNPPVEDKRMILSRKVQSELNLASLTRVEPSQSITDSVMSGFSGSIGDPLPDETAMLTPVIMDPPVECDAFIALRELGALLARRRGLKVDSFIDELMMLFSNAKDANVFDVYTKEQDPQLPISKHDFDGDREPDETLRPRRALRRFQSQPQLASDQKRRRHFSFEPGDDQLQVLEEELGTYEAKRPDSGSTNSETLLPAHSRNLTLRSHFRDSTPSSQTLSADFQKPSKIPSPVQTLGRIRRENSASSLQSFFARPDNNRRDSRSSILTTFRESSSGSLRPISIDRSNSIHNLRAGDTSLPIKDQSGSLRIRNSVIALGAAKAASENAIQTPIPRDSSPTRSSTRSSTASSSSRANRNARPLKPENYNSRYQAYMAE